MTVRDFYQVTYGSDKVTIKLDKIVVFRGRIRDIPTQYFESVILQIGVDYTHFSFTVSI